MLICSSKRDESSTNGKESGKMENGWMEVSLKYPNFASMIARKLLTAAIFLFSFSLLGQSGAVTIEEINLADTPPGHINHYWLKLIEDGLNQPVYVPLIVARGVEDGPVLGLLAALHGNELNGIGVIQRVLDKLDVTTLKGTVLAVPGLNAVSIPLHQRRYPDEEDLNRNFPGKATGNESQQYAWQINQKILPHLDYLIDMHTASFGRVNSLYVRADLSDEQIKSMAYLQDADIVLNNKGVPSANEQLAATRTMRAEAMLKGIPTITVEYGDPQVYQPEMIERGQTGVENTLSWLKMIAAPVQETPPAVVCRKSYWLYVKKGGYLEVPVQLTQRVKKGEIIGILRNPFGEVIEEYYCPEDGIVIGKSSNPVNRSGGRILHLGVE